MGQQPTTLAEFNNLLAKAGIQTLDRAQFQQLKQVRERDQLLRAASRMLHDDGAKIYIRKAISEVAPPPAQPAPQQSAPAGASTVSPAYTQATTGAGAPSDAGEGPAAEDSSEKPSERISVHVYGGKAALCFEADMTRGGDHTVALDAALQVGPRKYDWSNKIRLQLTRNELPMVAGVLLGYIPRCEFTNHGPQNNKGFSIDDQGHKLFCRVFAKDLTVRATPIEPEDAYRVATLVLRQLQQNSPWMGIYDIMASINSVVARRKVVSQ